MRAPRGCHILGWMMMFLITVTFAALNTAELAPPTEQRFALVVAPVGGTSHHPEWLESALTAGRNWDLVLLYFGDEGDSFTCDECVAIFHGRGAKWRLLSTFLNSTIWNEDLKNRNYSVIMAPDDDLTMTAGSLNLFFKIFQQYNLLIAQPAVCPKSYSFWHWFVGQRPNVLMRYTNFVELMAPTFATSVFNTTVRQTLGEAYTGWGLDFVWPFLLRYPRDSIAIVDAVCVDHAKLPESGRERVYSAEMPRNEYEEKDYLLEKFNYNEESLKEFSMKEWKPVEYSYIPLGELLLQTTAAADGDGEEEQLLKNLTFIVPSTAILSHNTVVWIIIFICIVIAEILFRRASLRSERVAIPD